MSTRKASRRLLLAAVVFVSGCGHEARVPAEPMLPAETFHWISQPITFSPPPSRWYREGDNGGGKLGVRFVLRNGGGQCISILSDRALAERDRQAGLARLVGRVDSLSQNEFLDQVSSMRARTDDPVSDREGQAALAINASLDRATTDYLAGDHGFALADIESALRTARDYQPTLDELLPRMRLHPERMQNPEYWRLGRGRDTVWAGAPAYASDDTLVLPEQTLLYHQVFWVVNGCAFEAIFQGRKENLETFHRVIDSIQFPDAEAHH